MEIVLQFAGIIPLLMGFAEHMGETRLKRLEDAVKSRFTLRGFVRLPAEVFKQTSLALTWSEAATTAAAFLVLVVMFREPELADIKDLWINFTIFLGVPGRWLSDTLGSVGDIVAGPFWILVALFVGVIIPLAILLLVVTTLILLLLYPLFGFLALTAWCKQQFGLTGSLIKLGSFGLAVLLYMASLVLKISYA